MNKNSDRYEELTDEQLVEISSEDIRARSVLASRYFFSIKACAKRISPETEEDLTQEGLMGLLSAAESYKADRGVKFSTYANVCVRNRMLSSLKKNLPVEASGLDDDQLEALADMGNIPEDIVIERERRSYLYDRIFSDLSELERQVFQLFLTGASYGGIASELGITRKTADNAMQRVRRKLKALLG